MNGATDLVIDGEGMGRFTSDLSPTNTFLPVAIRIRNGAHHITVQNLRADHLGYFINADDNDQLRTNLQFNNLIAEDMSEYGIFVAGDVISVVNCRVGDPNNPNVIGTDHDHGFRFYASNLTVTNCIADKVSNFGCWPVSGEHILIDGLTANAAIVFGPNPSYTGSGPEEHLYHTEIRDAQITLNSMPGPHLQGMRAELGTWRACIFDSSTANQFSIGQGTDKPPRALNRIHWSNLTGATATANNPTCIGADIGAVNCWGDVDSSGTVDVNDLLAVISLWGPCPAPPALPVVLGDPCPSNLSPCIADITPFVCGDNAVDVNDLLTVISAWGPCGGSIAGGSGGMPQSIQDCMDKCTEAGLEGEEWSMAVAKCIEWLCEQQIIDCD